MTATLSPVPNPDIVPDKLLTAPWQAWFRQLYTFLTATSGGGGGIVPATRLIGTTSPLAGGGDLSADRTLSINTNGITNSLLAQMPSLTLKGNNSGILANAADLTASQAKTLLAISLTTDVSGTLQAAQFPALTGDVTTPGGSLVTTIVGSSVTNAKLANMAANTIKGNNTGISATPVDLTSSQVKTLLAISLSTDVSGTLQAAQEPAHTGDVTNAAGSLALAIASNAVTNAQLAQMPTLTLKGNNTGGTANAADLTVAQVQALLTPTYLSYASSAGANNDVNPGGGWPTDIGRLDVTLAGGNANWTGLVAGVDGQAVLISNIDAANTLTLNNQNAGSSAANRFRSSADAVLGPGATVLATYYAGTVNRWVLR